MLAQYSERIIFGSAGWDIARVALGDQVKNPVLPYGASSKEKALFASGLPANGRR
jgi:hypothetical protein